MNILNFEIFEFQFHECKIRIQSLKKILGILLSFLEQEDFFLEEEKKKK